MIKIGIAGAAGKMGTAIGACAAKDNDIKITLAVEISGHKSIGNDFYGVKITDSLKDNADSLDVFIDFTKPQATVENLKIISNKKIAAVIGTTGFKEEEIKVIKEYSQNIPIVLSSNYSVGVNVMWKILKDITPVLKDDYDIDIVESHHRNKKDAPSGTAMTSGKIIAESKKIDFNKNVIYGREGRENERPRDQIGILAVRGGGVIGEHTIIYASDGDKIEIKHTAFSRETFAMGALKAAKFIVGKKPGIYSMADVLHI